jgi:hypothetical protein
MSADINNGTVKIIEICQQDLIACWYLSIRCPGKNPTKILFTVYNLYPVTFLKNV